MDGLHIDSVTNKKMTLYQLAKEANLQIENSVVDYLYNVTFSSNPNMGKGEIFASILFEYGKKPRRSVNKNAKGDVQVNSTSDELEIKGSGARLKGQKRIW